MKTEEVIKLYNQYVMPTYSQSPICLVRGKGIKVWDAEGKEYLDFFPGWAVSGLGHCHPMVISNIREQLSRIIHIPNNYYSPKQAELAGVLSKASLGGKVFFCNSGAEANEAAIKFARAYGYPAKYGIISMKDSFHGRTLAALRMTGQLKYQRGFGPLPKGFTHVPFNDIEAVKKAITPKTAGIIIELIQGEGGINVADKGYVKELRNLCNKKKLLLIFDEVQTGMGRTGKLFCYQHYGVEPDIMTLAKSLGGGVPIGALVARKGIADTLKPGMHASTFGGSPLVCSASLAVFRAIREEKLLSNAVRLGQYLTKRLGELKSKHKVINRLKGMGLMLGVELKRKGLPIVEQCRERGLLINCTRERTLRLMPPLIVTKSDIDKAMKILDEALQDV